MTKSKDAAAQHAAVATKARQPRAPKPKAQHSISNIRPIQNRTPARIRNPTPRPVTQPRASACPNPQCTSPDVQDGVCHSCGTIANDNNIVSEVTFGENAAGAAVLQGTFLADGKSHANTMGAAFNRLGGAGDGAGGHVDALRDGSEIIDGLKQAFRMDEAVVNFGKNLFKIITMTNFCQGRKVANVAVCALYAASRAMKTEQYNPSGWKDYQCKVMMIDFADHLGLNVFKLGRVFKVLLQKLYIVNLPILVPEDLMYRFAVKLDFGLDITKVATTAVRLAQRMQQDWMLTGRRPAGICGACILMAARLHNFRRTVQEVVYIVKVASGTIQKRLDEFKYTAASKMTVDEFLTNAPSTTEHDPPSFYQKTEEYKKTRKTRKRKRTFDHEDDEDFDEDEDEDEADRERSNASSSASPAPALNVQPQLDADGFAIPALPTRKKARNNGSVLPTPPSTQSPATSTQSPASEASASNPTNASPEAETPEAEAEIAIEPSLLDGGAPDGVEDLEHFAENFGDGGPEPDEDTGNTAPAGENDPEVDAEIEQTITEFMEGSVARESAEAVVASHLTAHPPKRGQIATEFNDPNSEVHKKHMAIAKQQADIVSLMVATTAVNVHVSNDVHIGEDEFADDPEVTNCILSDAEKLIKTKIWYNENKEWLIRQLEKKQTAHELAKNPKTKRKRKKTEQMGKGQKEPMATSHEAAIAALQRRSARTRNGETRSKKINYDAIKDMLSKEDGSVPSSSSTSRATSVAPAPRREGSAKLAASIANSRASSRARSEMSEEPGNFDDYNTVVSNNTDVGNSLMDTLDDEPLDYDEIDMED